MRGHLGLYLNYKKKEKEVAQGKKKKKDHTGNLERNTCDKQALLEEVNGFPNGQIWPESTASLIKKWI